jgi:hypothetical protein
MKEQPRKGAKAEGTKGAIKGVAKALAGYHWFLPITRCWMGLCLNNQLFVRVIIKPTVGCLDLISQTTEGIKNVTKLEFVIERRRPPRYFGPKHHNITVTYHSLSIITQTDEEAFMLRQIFCCWSSFWNSFVWFRPTLCAKPEDKNFSTLFEQKKVMLIENKRIGIM